MSQRNDAISIRYAELNDVEARRRLRIAAESKNGFRWDGPGKIVPYGLWRLKPGNVIFVEGESDCWTLWHTGYNALGIPGATSAKCIEAEHLRIISSAYIWQETDGAGALFVKSTTERLFKIGWGGKCLLLGECGFKDPSDLYVEAGPEKFKKDIEYLIQRAKPVWYEPKPEPNIRRREISAENGTLVERAKSIRLEELLEIKPGSMVRCPFHDDQKPSAWVKNGYGYCFPCGKSFDSIEYIRKTKDLDFMGAVKYLCGK